ncbi:nicotinate-nicotinamide nucleotide adenylyltransferase [Candidatus Odyssella acanthamoebae]|uniref:nicotinate-nucleotide adenylyltransferase n=1 Tax=Candidatus Odyssella acanthamoebae TaxID=91604 RepID=A0A077AWI8_9PROT|nr:hypothetical protein [Candidatus Paracaedibacter acanthamoebae]AIK95998.1 hypothetical protein ID47_03460 [Candidatus Paracaedibacter acanthamoebae]
MNLLKYLTLGIGLINSAEAVVLEDIIEGKYKKAGSESMISPETCTFSTPMEEADSIPALVPVKCSFKEPLLTVEEGGPDDMDEDVSPDTADEEGEVTTIEDDVWPSRNFEEGVINQAVAEFFLRDMQEGPVTVGYYLGSFDPMHKGHKEVATQIIERNICNYTLMCPIWGGDDLKKRTDVKIRLDMIFAVFKDDPRVIVTRLSPAKIQEVFAKRQSPNSKDIVVKIPGLKFKGIIGSDIPQTFYEKMQENVPNFMGGTVISPERRDTTYGAVDALPVESYVIALRDNAPEGIQFMDSFVGKPVNCFLEPTPFCRSYSSSEIKLRLREGKPISNMVYPSVEHMIDEKDLYERGEMKDPMAPSSTDVESSKEGDVEVLHLPSERDERTKKNSQVPASITVLITGDKVDDSTQFKDSNNNHREPYKSCINGLISPRYGKFTTEYSSSPSNGRELDLDKENRAPFNLDNPFSKFFASPLKSFTSKVGSLTKRSLSKSQSSDSSGGESDADMASTYNAKRPLSKSQSSGTTRDKLKISPPSTSVFLSLALSPRSPCSPTSNQSQAVNILNMVAHAN